MPFFGGGGGVVREGGKPIGNKGSVQLSHVPGYIPGLYFFLGLY